MGFVKCGLVALALLALQHQTLAQVHAASGGLFDKESEVDLSTGDNSAPAAENNGYLPPIGGSPSENVPAFSGPPNDPDDGRDDSPTNVFPPALVQPQLGCAAALLCVEEQFCTMTGVISKSPLQLTEAQKLRRVPMVDCRNPESGIIGKCCRDPEYVDPWPAGNLTPEQLKQGFDEQGFPKFLNLSKTKPQRPSRPMSIPASQFGQVIRPQQPIVLPQQPQNFQPAAPIQPPQTGFQQNKIVPEIKPLQPQQPSFGQVLQPGFQQRPTETKNPFLPQQPKPFQLQPEQPTQAILPGGSGRIESAEFSQQAKQSEIILVPEQPAASFIPEQPQQAFIPQQPSGFQVKVPQQPQGFTTEQPEFFQPEQPRQPSFIRPQQPQQPAFIQPAQPAQPEQPEVFQQPEQPGLFQPEQPKQPLFIRPIQPQQPAFIQPAQPEQPEVFQQPEQPEQPGFFQPEQPKQPSFIQPEQPKQPAFIQPAQPEQPEVFQQPEKPAFFQPEQPQQQGQYQPEQPAQQPGFFQPEQPSHPSGYQPDQSSGYQPAQPQQPGYSQTKEQPKGPFGLPDLQDIPQAIANQFQNYNPFNKPEDTETVNAPTLSDTEVTTKKPFFQGFPSFPSFPSIPNPFGQKVVQNQPGAPAPVVIAPHAPGAQCGIINQVQQNYAGGLNDVQTPFGEIPWQAMILHNTEKKLICSGAVISPNVVMTAAHCVYGMSPSEVSIKVGEWKLGYELKHEEPLPFEIAQVQNIETHPGYQPGGPGSDLAMLFLEKPVKLDQHVDTICLGDQQQLQPAESVLQRKCISVGWGKEVLQLHAAGALMNKIQVDALSQDQCQSRLQGAESPIDLDNSLICVKAHKQSNNMCQVDVGGPLACDRGDGHYELIGVYSQDTGCLPTNQVATFALIDNKWVNDMLNSASFVAPQQVPQESGNFEGPAPGQETPSRIHYHPQQPGVPCDCQQGTQPAGSNAYLPPY